jgi:hypothetical protein
MLCCQSRDRLISNVRRSVGIKAEDDGQCNTPHTFYSIAIYLSTLLNPIAHLLSICFRTTVGHHNPLFPSQHTICFSLSFSQSVLPTTTRRYLLSNPSITLLFLYTNPSSSHPHVYVSPMIWRRSIWLSGVSDGSMCMWLWCVRWFYLYNIYIYTHNICVVMVCQMIYIYKYIYIICIVSVWYFRWVIYIYIICVWWWCVSDGSEEEEGHQRTFLAEADVRKDNR